MSLPTRLLSLAGGLCGDDAVNRVFEPLVADWHREWREAPRGGQPAVLIGGAFAYARAIVSCLDVSEAASRLPIFTYSSVLLIFATVGTMFALQPVHYTWIGFTPRFRWIPTASHAIYFVPNMLAHYAGFAMLPAVLFATRARLRWQSVAAFIALTLAAMLIVEGWVHPALMHARSRIPTANMPQPGSSQLVDLQRYTNISKTITLAVREESDIAAFARAALWDRAYWVAQALSSALFGAALGIVARRRQWRFSIPRAAALWLMATLLFWTIVDWGWVLAILLSLPRGATFWMPSATFALLGVLALATGLKRRPEIRS